MATLNRQMTADFFHPVAEDAEFVRKIFWWRCPEEEQAEFHPVGRPAGAPTAQILPYPASAPADTVLPGNRLREFAARRRCREELADGPATSNRCGEAETGLAAAFSEARPEFRTRRHNAAIAFGGALLMASGIGAATLATLLQHHGLLFAFAAAGFLGASLALFAAACRMIEIRKASLL